MNSHIKLLVQSLRLTHTKIGYSKRILETDPTFDPNEMNSTLSKIEAQVAACAQACIQANKKLDDSARDVYAFLFLLIDTDLAYLQLLPSRTASTQPRRRLEVQIESSPAHLETNADKYEAFSARCSASLEAYHRYESQLKAAIHSNAHLRSNDALWTRRRSESSNHGTTPSSPLNILSYKDHGSCLVHCGHTCIFIHTMIHV